MAVNGVSEGTRLETDHQVGHLVFLPGQRSQLVDRLHHVEQVEGKVNVRPGHVQDGYHNLGGIEI